MGVAAHLYSGTGSADLAFFDAVPSSAELENTIFHRSGASQSQAARPMYAIERTGMVIDLNIVEFKDRNIKQIQNLIQQAFSLDTSQFAQVCKVTRKTVYDWADSTPQEANLRRLYLLEKLARNWINSGFSIQKNQLQMNVIGNDSLLDLLCLDSIDEQKILFAGTRLNMQAEPQTLNDPF